MNAATTSSDQSVMPAASRQRSARRRSMSSSRRSMRVGLAMRLRVGGGSDGARPLRWPGASPHPALRAGAGPVARIAEGGKKLNMAVGMLDHSAGIAVAAGAEVVVFHPGFLLNRTREEAIDSVVEQLCE